MAAEREQRNWRASGFPFDVMMFPYDQQDEALLLTRLVELGMAIFIDHDMNFGEVLQGVG
jgi:hypothetical protein